MRADFSLNSIRRRHGRVVRGLAVFFLLFTSADIALPQYFCEEEVGGIPLSRALPADATERDLVASVSSVSSSKDSRPEAPDREAPHEEDCFCCCAHVLPGLILSSVGASDASSSADLLPSDSLPSPPLRGTYRPPRFA